MPDATDSKVNLHFDGLLRYALDRSNNLCEIKAHTAAKGHVLKIRVTANGQLIAREVYCAESLKTLHPFFIFVVEAGADAEPLPRSVRDDGSFNQILDLASAPFYQRPRATKPKQYESSFWLLHGAIGAEDEDACQRVKQSLFGALKFNWKTSLEWEAFRDGVRLVDPEAIKDLPAPFAKNVMATVPLAVGQSLRLRSGGTSADLFAPLAAGPVYDVWLDYADVDSPQTLADCGGLANHSEALHLDAGEPVFGVFKPASFGDAQQVGARTDSGCCEGVRLGSADDLLNEFLAIESLLRR